MSKRNPLPVTLAGIGAGVVGLCGLAPPAVGSSHREAPAISQDPVADNADLYAWVKPGTRDKLYVVATYNPLEEPAGGPNFNEFSDEVLYEIHITKGVNSLNDFRTYQFRFQKTPLERVDVADLNAPPGKGKEFFAQLSGQRQFYTVTMLEAGKAPQVIVNAAARAEVAPPNIGPRTSAAVYNAVYGAVGATYNDAFAASFIKSAGSHRVWAGPRDDGFYVDLGGVFDLANLRAKGTAQDGVAGYNVHAIVLEIPTAELTGGSVPNGPSNDNLLGVWASASRRQVSLRLRNGETFSFGPWVQVSRLGLPLVNEAVIGLQDKDRWNYSRPSQEGSFFPYFLNPIIVRDAEVVGIYTALGVDPTPFKSNRLDVIDVINLKNIPNMNAHAVPVEPGKTGDVLRVDPGVESGFPNGRPIPGAMPNREQADVTDVLLRVLLAKGANPGNAITDGVDYNDRNFLTDMPFLALPFEGRSGGHGKPTP